MLIENRTTNFKKVHHILHARFIMHKASHANVSSVYTNFVMAKLKYSKGKLFLYLQWAKEVFIQCISFTCNNVGVKTIKPETIYIIL